MVQKRLDAKWSGFRMSFDYRTAQPFEYQTNRTILFSFKYWLGIIMVSLVHVANGPGPTIQIPDTDPVFIFGPNFKQCLKVWMTLWYSNGKIT